MLSAVLALALAACARSNAAESKTGKAPLTERQRDSVIGDSRLPGAGGVKAALRVSDSASAKRAREDSISSQP